MNDPFGTWELIKLQREYNKLSDLVLRISGFPCCYCVYTATCIFCDAKSLVKELKDNK